jgi:hypothetical protein
VISIETIRSNTEFLGEFGTFEKMIEIGLAVDDIHQPRVPTIDETTALIGLALQRIPTERSSVNLGWDHEIPRLAAGRSSANGSDRGGEESAYGVGVRAKGLRAEI